MLNPSLTTQDTEMIDLKKQTKRYKVYRYYGGEFQDEIRWTSSLDTARQWSLGCEHCEIVDTHDNDKFIEPYTR